MWNKQYSKGRRVCGVKQGRVLLFNAQTAHCSTTRGVTLVEMLVAFAIMSVTFVIVLDAFISSNRAAQVAQRRAEVADALSYVLADMAREAQVSGQYAVTGPGGNSFLMKRADTIVDIAGETVLYRLQENRLKKEIGGTGLLIPITSDPIWITDLQLILLSSGANLKKVMRVIIKAHHRDREGPEEPEVVLQTTFVER